MLRHSQVDGVEAEPVPDYSLLSFIAPGSIYGSSSSCYLHWSGAKSCESETGVTELIRACGTCRETAAFTSKIILGTGGRQEGVQWGDQKRSNNHMSGQAVDRELRVGFPLRSNEKRQAAVCLLQTRCLPLGGTAALVVHPGLSWERAL